MKNIKFVQDGMLSQIFSYRLYTEIQALLKVEEKFLKKLGFNF